MSNILVLGGYGFFGSRICQALSQNKNIHLIVSGRDITKARALAAQLNLQREQGIAIDAQDSNLASKLKELNIHTVIHTAGPFQNQNYAVARASILAGANYIDLADGRDFVSGIRQLNDEARERGVLVVSGASSLPALSSAVVDRYIEKFSQLNSIRHGIGSGARAPGLATMRGVFSYCGKSFLRMVDGRWQKTYGWLDTQIYQFPDPVGSRLLGSCDVPDLVLFPSRYQGVQTVTFHAGFAGTIGHLFVWLASLVVRANLLSSLTPLALPLNKVSKWMEYFTSDKGGMFVTLEGVDKNNQPLQLRWHLIAAQNHGPYIPCGASIALAQKLTKGGELPCGAMPCMGLLTVEDYLSALQGYDIKEVPA